MTTFYNYTGIMIYSEARTVKIERYEWQRMQRKKREKKVILGLRWSVKGQTCVICMRSSNVLALHLQINVLGVMKELMRWFSVLFIFNWRAACKKLVSDYLGRIFFLVQMSSIFACDLGLNRKTLSRNFFCCFVFRFREIFFNQHWRQMRASLILLFGKTEAFFGKDTARKKTAFLHTLFVENERETSKLK